MVSLVYTRSAAAHNLSDSEQAYAARAMDKNMVNARPIIDRVTCPLLPSVVPDDEGSKVCAADSWIDEGWEHVTGTHSNLSG